MGPMGRGVDPSMKCDVASSTTAYTEVKGYMLNMATFDGGSFFANGSAMASMMIASMTTASANKDATIATHATTIAKLEKDKVKRVLIMDQQEANLSEAKEDKMPTWAIAIIVVIGAMFLLVVVILGVVVSREQQGKPVFVPTSKKSVGAA